MTAENFASSPEELPSNIYEHSFEKFYTAFCTGVAEGKDPIFQSNNKEHDAEANFFLENAVFNLQTEPGLKKKDFLNAAKLNINTALDSLLKTSTAQSGKYILKDLWNAYYHPSGILYYFPNTVSLEKGEKRREQLQLICNSLLLFHHYNDGYTDFNLLDFSTWNSYVNLFSLYQKEVFKKKKLVGFRSLYINRLTKLLSLDRWVNTIEDIRKSTPDIIIVSLGSANNELQFNPAYARKLAEDGKRVHHLNCDYFSEKRLKIAYENGGELQTNFADIFFKPDFDTYDEWIAPLQTMLDNGQEIIINSYLNCAGLHPEIVKFAQNNLDKIGTHLKLVFGHEDNQACFVPAKAFFEQKVDSHFLSACGAYKFRDKEEYISMDNIQALNDTLQERNITHLGYFARLPDIGFKESSNSCLPISDPISPTPNSNLSQPVVELEAVPLSTPEADILKKKTLVKSSSSHNLEPQVLNGELKRTLLGQITVLKKNIENSAHKRKTRWYTKEKIARLQVIADRIEKNELKSPSQILAAIRDVCATHRHPMFFGGLGQTHSSKEFNSWLIGTFQKQFPDIPLPAACSKPNDLKNAKSIKALVLSFK